MSGLVLPSDLAGGMIKVCSWDAFAPDGWPYVHALHTDGRGSRAKFAAWTKKFASRETSELVERFVKEAQPKVGHSYFLGTALGGYEAWGCNSNGDAFYEEDLVKESDDIGYRSFQKHAHVFEHHKNKDPSIALGKIVLATFNKKMRRVELIEEVSNEKGAHLLDQWHRNGSLPTSMGCKVAFDVCSSCGNKARTPKEYCEHAKYAMKKIARDGHRYHVRNPDPRFFDQSHVIIPAEKTAGVMEKIACYFPGTKLAAEDSVLSAVVGEAIYQSGTEKSASEAPETPAVAAGLPAATDAAHDTNVDETRDEVLSEEDQRILKLAAETDPELPPEVLRKLAHAGLEMAVASMGALGIVPSPREFQFLALHAAGEQGAKLAEQLYLDEITFEPSPLPEKQAIDPYEKVAYAADWNVSPTLVEMLAPFVPTRSFIPEFLGPRIEKAAAMAKSGAEVVPAEQIRTSDPGVARVMLALGLSYGIVRAIMGEDKQLASGLAKVTRTHPAVAAALLTAGCAAGLKVVNSAITPGHVAPRPGAKYEKVSAFIDDLEKTAGMNEYAEWVKKTPSSVKRVVVPFSLGYLSSAYLRGKQMRGQETNSMENVLADHPLASGVAAVAGTALARKGLRKLVAAAKP